MARKTGAKSQGKNYGDGRSKARGPNSNSQALRTRSINEIMGVEPLDFRIENEILTPKTSLST